MVEQSAVFTADDERVSKTIVALDIADSTSMKETMREAEWITTYAWFYSLVARLAEEKQGRIVKYLGDGAMAVFESAAAANAINFAIAVQEAIRDALEKNRYACKCSIGIASGDVIEFDLAGVRDYIATSVDKAFRLCAAANVWAIFVDPDTTMAANMSAVESGNGRNSTPRRKASQYQGTEQAVNVKGFSSAVTYYEILWAQDRFSVNPNKATELSGGKTVSGDGAKGPSVGREAPAGATAKTEAPRQRGSVWSFGEVVKWDDVKKDFGFIRSEGEDFHFNLYSLFRKALPVREGTQVAFIPTESSATEASGKKSRRRAVDVIPVGAVLSGTLARLPMGKPFGFVECVSDRSTMQEFFIFFGAKRDAFHEGMTIEFTTEKEPTGRFGGKFPRQATATSTAPETT